jgi:RES domain
LTGRERRSQGHPPTDLSGFPDHLYPSGTRLWRAARQDPWWYCSCGGCRFDLRDPRGTCYLGTDELSGIIESIGPEIESGVVATEYLDARRLFGFKLSSELRAADLVSRRAVGKGVTNELSTMVPYEVPQEWAKKLDESGFSAIRYRTRFDTGATARGLAQFAKAGLARRAPGTGRQIDATLVRRLETECGVTVAPAPALAELEIADGPGP